MKLKHLITVISCAAGMSVPQLTHAQGDYLDNTGQPVAGNNMVGLPFNNRVDVEFKTGTNAAGYTLNSITFLMANASVTPSPSSIELDVLAADDNTPIFGNFDISGSNNPTNAGLHTFSVPSATLAANTDYWVSLLNPGSGDYEWSYANNTAATSSDGWSITGNPNPLGETVNGSPMFAINATAVPEPSLSALLVIGTLAALGGARLRRA